MLRKLRRVPHSSRAERTARSPVDSADLGAGHYFHGHPSRHLQDQLFHQDLPLLRQALDIQVQVALLKSRANYLCQHRLQTAEQEGRFSIRAQAGELQRIRRWSRRTQRGDIAETVVQARIENLRQRGENPFITYQLPHAVITLKQEGGRLIRDVTDRGVLALGAPRLLTRFYGWTFLDSLPPMPRTRKLERVQAFFAADPAGS